MASKAIIKNFKQLVEKQERRNVVRLLAERGHGIRAIERITGLSYITVYRIVNPSTAH